eukprot:jgi/Hompol1/5709/HPOL_004643-RA
MATAPAPPAPAPARDDLIASAVRFLQDPKVQSAPLAKRIAFLESKNLTSAEIERALSLATNSSNSGSSAAPPPIPPKDMAQGYSQSQSQSLPQSQSQMQMQLHPAYQGYPVHPQPAAWSWKDYVLGGIAVAGASYGLIHLASKYFGDSFVFPTSAMIKRDTDAIALQLDKTGTAVDLVNAQTADLLKAVESHASDLVKTLGDLTLNIRDLEEADRKRALQVERIENELESLKQMLPKMLEKSKETQTALLNEVQTEIKSLKSLFLNRRVGAGAPAILAAGSTLESPAALSQTSAQIMSNGGDTSMAAGGLVGQSSISVAQNGSASAAEVGVAAGVSPGLTAASADSRDSGESAIDGGEQGIVRSLLSGLPVKPTVPSWQIEAARAAKAKRSIPIPVGGSVPSASSVTSTETTDASESLSTEPLP